MTPSSKSLFTRFRKVLSTLNTVGFFIAPISGLPSLKAERSLPAETGR